uniref:Uncharacterized protein n=1 Tax=Vitrella brassicaformis TaxID=1169539 RepID=A0A7S1P6H4_9ALVE|mmetsp:Transcript_32812/g.81268  ORF Transcript_32812/g.81268 Transcript_32812/m.81268 type:complete len:131 (+) Transcript_32812:346-738(+)
MVNRVTPGKATNTHTRRERDEYTDVRVRLPHTQTDKHTYICMHINVSHKHLSVGQQMAGRQEMDTPPSCVVTFSPPSCVYVWMCISQHCGTHIHTETLRQADRGKTRQQGTHKFQSAGRHKKLAPPPRGL